MLTRNFCVYNVCLILFFTELKDLEEQSRNANARASETAQQVLMICMYMYIDCVFQLTLTFTQ